MPQARSPTRTRQRERESGDQSSCQRPRPEDGVDGRLRRENRRRTRHAAGRRRKRPWSPRRARSTWAWAPAHRTLEGKVGRRLCAAPGPPPRSRRHASTATLQISQPPPPISLVHPSQATAQSLLASPATTTPAARGSLETSFTFLNLAGHRKGAEELCPA